MMRHCEPHIVIHLAANTGGIGYHQSKHGEIFYDNLMMGAHVMEAARLAKVEKMVCVGTACSYPAASLMPMREETFWVGYPDASGEFYGIAKKMLLTQARAYRKQYAFKSIYLVLTNLYGPGDNFHREDGHVIPALCAKVMDALEAKHTSVEFWGNGESTRDFLYIDDAVEAIVKAAELYQGTGDYPINIASGLEVKIWTIMDMICEEIGFKGVTRSSNGPDTQSRRVLDTQRSFRDIRFQATTSLKDGLHKTIEWYKAKRASGELT